MGLYLQQIFDTKVGVIILTIPDPSGEGADTVLQGFLTENVSLSFQNNWGSIFPDFNVLGEMSQLMGSANIFSWLASTQAGWKGTEPITLGTEFYVISYKRRTDGTNIKTDVKKLLKMATLYSGTGLLAGETVQIHGGYANNYWQNNNTYLESANNLGDENKKGLIKLQISDQLTLNNLLLADVNVTPSVVQVDNGVPLYIKVNANFRTYRAPLSSDIDAIFD